MVPLPDTILPEEAQEVINLRGLPRQAGAIIAVLREAQEVREAIEAAQEDPEAAATEVVQEDQEAVAIEVLEVPEALGALEGQGLLG